MDDSLVDEVSLAVVREYLSSKKLIGTLKAMDAEIPRSNASISSRSALIQHLHVEKKMKHNKEQAKPLSSILEVVVKHLLEKANVLHQKRHPKNDKVNLNTVDLKTSTMEVKNTIKLLGADHGRDQPRKKQIYDDLIVDDVEDLDNINSNVALGKLMINSRGSTVGEEISLSKANDLKQLLFGSTNGKFNTEWKMQNFQFSNEPTLTFGLVQKKGGPCGIMASLQSYIVKELLFPSNRLVVGLKPNERQQNAVLITAMSEILWHAGEKRRATVATFDVGRSGDGIRNFEAEALLENLKLFSCFSYQQLQDCVRNRLAAFTNEGRFGCISFLCSAVLSRGIENVRAEMDEPEGQLLGAHGYCTQEIVNLLLTGHAFSNVFDGTVELQSGGTEKTVLRGINDSSSIGFLSLFEYYQSCEVGQYFKNPGFPIWVIYSESHFSVLFAKEMSLAKAESKLTEFDLFYYDGLMRQDSEIKLQIKLAPEHKPFSEKELVSPIEHCIRTRWPSATISWFGHEPIL